MASKTLYIGNLPYSATETQIADHFKKYGATNVRIVEGRGFGFVDVDGKGSSSDASFATSPPAALRSACARRCRQARKRSCWIPGIERRILLASCGAMLDAQGCFLSAATR